MTDLTEKYKFECVLVVMLFIKIGCYLKVFIIIHIYIFPVLKRKYYSDFKCMEKMLSETEATLWEKVLA